MNFESFKRVVKTLLIAALAAIALAAALALCATAVGLALWTQSRAPKMEDLSDGALPRTFETRNPELQLKLRDLALKKELPNQRQPKEFEAISWRIQESLTELMTSQRMAPLVDAMDRFEESRSKEPRYADWPDASSTPEQIEDFLRFLRFNSDSALAVFNEDEPFLKAEGFINAIAKISAPVKRPAGAEVDPADLKDLCKLKLFLSLAEGRRAKALRMLNLMFKLASSPLMPGLDGEIARNDAAGCAAAMLRTPGWTGRELKALERIVDREAAAPFRSESAVANERLATLDAFERTRAASDKKSEALDLLLDAGQYYDEAGARGLLCAAQDLFSILARDIDAEEAAELEMLDALERKGFLPEHERESFIRSLKRDSLPLSEAEISILRDYSTVRSHADATLKALLAALRASLDEEQRPSANPFTGAPSFSVERTKDGFQADIAPAEGQRAFAPFPAEAVEIPPRKM